MPTLSPWAVMRDAEGALLVGHVAIGNGVAGLVNERAQGSTLVCTAATLGVGSAVHGGNEAGVVCAALDVGAVGHDLVRAVLRRVMSAEEAGELVRDVWSKEERPRSAAVLVADASSALLITVSAGGVGVSTATSDTRAPLMRDVEDHIAHLRTLEPQPEEGAVPACALAAVLRHGEAPRLLMALGPPSTSVFIRHWPGMEIGPDESAAPEGAALARLAVAVAQATQSDPQLRHAARQRLDRAETEALREGEAAERMAARMDADTDDRGAAVRRLVAQAYAVDLARQALEELAVPAPPRRGERARL